jgi:predicted GTPase
MFEDTIRTISDCHGIIERELQSEFFEHFSGDNQNALHSWRDHLRSNRARLTRVERTLTDPLWVVLLGRFSSGKSTLINAFFRLAGGNPTRLTGRHPTDTRATLIQHHSSNTGILETEQGQHEIEGLGISIDRHSLDDLKDLIIVDTPGFWDHEETDLAVMRFLGHADVILHCMTPDSLLNLADKAILDKRKTYFSSQVYHVVVTKAQTDTAYASGDGSINSGEWEKDLAVLRNRFSAYTGENLAPSPCARSHGVWLIDSQTDYQVRELLKHIQSYAADSVDNVPRVRAPIARDRLKYVCSQTVDQVVAPLLLSLEACNLAIANAKSLLQEEKKRYMASVLGPNRESLRLRIREIKHLELRPTMDAELAAGLGVSFLLDTQVDGHLPGIDLALVQFKNNLADAVEAWKQSARCFPEYALILNRHKLNQEILEKAKDNLKIDVVREYTDWFDQRDCGRQLQELLHFESLSDLMRSGPRRLGSRIPRDTPEGEPEDGSAMTDVSQQSAPPKTSTDDPAARHANTTAMAVADGPGTLIEELRRRSDFTPQSFENTLVSVFESGTHVVLENSNTGGDSQIMVSLMENVRRQLDEERDHYASTATAVDSTSASQLVDMTDSVIARVRDSVIQKVDEVVNSMRESFQVTLCRVHGDLLGKGIDVKVVEERSAAWESADKNISEPALAAVHEDFGIPAKNDLENLAAFSREAVDSLGASLHRKNDDLHTLIQPDLILLRSTAEMYIDNSRGLAQTAVGSLKVFDGFKYSDNFFDEKGIGGELERELSVDLAHLCDTLANTRRSTLWQLIAFGSATLVFSTFQLALVSGVVSFASSLSGSVEQVAIGLIGVSAAGFLNALWRVLVFRKNSRATLLQKAKEQMERICIHSKMNLDEDSRKEKQAFAAAETAIQGAISTFARSGVSSLANHLIDHTARSLQQLVGSCEQERLLAGKQIKHQLEMFRNSCHKHVDKVSDRTSEILRDGCSETMSTWMSEAQRELDQQSERIAAIEKEIASAEARMNGAFNLAP